MRGYSAMDRLAITAVVLRRNVGADQLPFGAREAAGTAHENLRHFAHGRGDFGAKQHRPSWACYAFIEWNVWQSAILLA
jgi:hypothetical protein